MKVNNTTIFMGDETSRLRHGKSADKAGNAGRKSLDGTSLATKTDLISAKREEAKKRAMKIVGDAFENEVKVGDDLNARRAKVRHLQQDIADAQKVINETEAQRSELRDLYKVSEDSKEEQDLKLLEKEIRSKMPGSDIHLTKEEKEQAALIRENGLSEYQERSLSMLEDETFYVQTVYEATAEVKLHNQVITATELEHLKSHTMVDARKNAEAIMDAATDEIASMLVDEAKAHIEEEAKKNKEEAKAEKEKQDEIQEKIDEARARRKKTEKITEDILEEVQDTSNKTQDINTAQQEIKDMMSKMKLIEDDIKGAAVDESV